MEESSKIVLKINDFESRQIVACELLDAGYSVRYAKKQSNKSLSIHTKQYDCYIVAEKPEQADDVRL